jgi:hypothetical protein
MVVATCGASGKGMATFLGGLKQTFADLSEILRAEWIDLKGNIFSINLKRFEL